MALDSEGLIHRDSGLGLLQRLEDLLDDLSNMLSDMWVRVKGISTDNAMSHDGGSNTLIQSRCPGLIKTLPVVDGSYMTHDGAITKGTVGQPGSRMIDY